MHFNPNQAREIIMNNYSYVLKNKTILNQPTTVYSDSCADTLMYEITTQDEYISKIDFNAKGCAIFLASTKILFELIQNNSFDEALKIIELFEIFVNQQRELNDEELSQISDLWVFYNVKTHLNRVNCVLVSANEIKSKLI